MSYKIRTCKECGQKLHIRKKGRLLYLKNRCVHFDKPTINATRLDERTIPIEQFVVPTAHLHEFPQLCVMHKTIMVYRRYLRRFTELYYCSKCATVGKLIPMEHIKWWKKRTRTSKWQPGDVVWWHA